MSTISSLRQDINEVDQQILALLNKRASLAVAVGCLKQEQGLPRVDAEREQKIIQSLIQSNQGPLAKRDVEKIYGAILEVCHSLPLEEGEGSNER